ncbi:hypothetical protein J6590_058597 [Homalodisca vitripennis]|nr:hypothetical protein J6590_058597 [Homalodisca vitripennis]
MQVDEFNSTDAPRKAREVVSLSSDGQQPQGYPVPASLTVKACRHGAPGTTVGRRPLARLSDTLSDVTRSLGRLTYL